MNPDQTAPSLGTVADPEGVRGVCLNPFETKLFLFRGEFSEKSGRINEKSGKVNKSEPPLKI